MKRFALTIPLLLIGTAFAQAATPADPANVLAILGIDLALLGGSALVFAKAIQFIVEQIKGWWTSAPTGVLIVLPFLIGLGGAFLLSRTVGITDPAFAAGGWFAFGIVSALIAGGWYETQKKTALRSAGVKEPQ